MTPAHPHRIGRQVLELDLASAEATAPRLQEEAARPFREGALPALEELFDRVAGPDRLVRLERLEVDLGELTGADWPRQLLGRLAERLREALPAALAPSGAAGTEGLPASAPAAEAWLGALLFFLVHGHLPWWGARSAGAWEEAPPVVGAGPWRPLAELLRLDRRARRRLVQAAGDGFLAAAVAALAGLERGAEVVRLLAPAAQGRDGRYATWRRRFWERLLEHALDAPPDAGTGQRLMRRLLADRQELAAGVGGRPAAGSTSGEPAAVTAPPALPRLPAPWQAWLEAAVAQPPAAPADAGERGGEDPKPARRERPGSSGGELTRTVEPASGESPELRHPPPLPPAGGEVVTGPRAGAEPALGEEPVVAEAIDLPGAGAVILHPFLPELFASRGLLDGPRWRNEAARHRAVHLLGWLTFGAEAPEHDLLLPKLLSAMPWEELLPPAELDDEDREACSALLTAVLGHWRALRSASPEWLREQFFLRQGRIERVDQGWRLTVERRAQDVLLTRLPWGVGLVRLPWLPEVLHVRWMD